METCVDLIFRYSFGKFRPFLTLLYQQNTSQIFKIFRLSNQITLGFSRFLCACWVSGHFIPLDLIKSRKRSQSKQIMVHHEFECCHKYFTRYLKIDKNQRDLKSSGRTATFYSGVPPFETLVTSREVTLKNETTPRSQAYLQLAGSDAI